MERLSGLGRILRCIFLLVTSITTSIVAQSIDGTETSQATRPDSSKDEVRFDYFAAPLYDSNVGFGIVGKTFLYNACERHESFDITAMGTTKGEFWLRFVGSLPDFETRQGTIYPLAVDFVFDFDTFTHYNFFGVGNESKKDDLENYRHQTLELSLAAARGIRNDFTVQAGMRFRSILNMRFDPSGRLMAQPNPNSHGRAVTHSLYVNAAYDSRNSYVNPSRGTIARVEFERAFPLSWTNASFIKQSWALHHYEEIFFPKTVFAVRFGFQHVAGDDLPIQSLITLGSHNTLRGFPLERFLDNTAMMANAEIRLPIYWRFGAIVGVDAGKVWSAVRLIDLRWRSNLVAGLRLYYDTFVVRGDVGFSSESTGIYLNFGQAF